MQKHHYMARLQRLRRVVAEAKARVDELQANPAQDRTTKRVRTMATRTLDENRASLLSLIERHGAQFGNNEEGRKEHEQCEGHPGDAQDAGTN